MNTTDAPFVALDGAPLPMSAAEFEWIIGFLRTTTGIELKAGKEALVSGRLDRRLRHHGLRRYAEYFTLLSSTEDLSERRIAIDLLTTNETYFFREPQHFDLLRRLAEAVDPPRVFRAWSAAASSGEEACSIAMTLQDTIGDRWEVVATDLSSRVVASARRGLYPVSEAERVPAPMLSAYCLRGHGEFEGMMALRPSLQERIRFEVANLTRPLPDLGGPFDVIFLRNVLIYFGADTKRAVVERIVELLRPTGHLLIGHAESLTGLDIPGLRLVSPSVYERVPERRSA